MSANDSRYFVDINHIDSVVPNLIFEEKNRKEFDMFSWGTNIACCEKSIEFVDNNSLGCANDEVVNVDVFDYVDYGVMKDVDSCVNDVVSSAYNCDDFCLEVFDVNGCTTGSLNGLKQQIILRNNLQLLHYRIKGLPRRKVDIIIWVFLCQTQHASRTQLGAAAAAKESEDANGGAIISKVAAAGTTEEPGSVIACGSSWAKTCGIGATSGGAVADRAATSADAVADWAATSADAVADWAVTSADVVADWPATIEGAGADWAATTKAAGAASVVRGSAKSCVGSADCSGARTTDSDSYSSSEVGCGFVIASGDLVFVSGSSVLSSGSPVSAGVLAGDLIYLNVVTLVGNIYSITGTTKNFYVNSSTANVLDTRPGKTSSEATTITNVMQLARAENALTLSFGSELIGMQRDWNEELQSCSEFSHGTLQESH
nr:clustered mitochondria protein [Ipomoea batatas]